jgi:hypothetical protein
MMYQLPSGKVIYLTLEEYLDLSDQDLQDLIGTNIGAYPTSIWEGSSIKSRAEKINVKNELDYKEDSEEVQNCHDIISIDSLTIDEIESMEDQDDSSEEDC